MLVAVFNQTTSRSTRAITRDEAWRQAIQRGRAPTIAHRIPAAASSPLYESAEWRTPTR
jgi:hypothetical protein